VPPEADHDELRIAMQRQLRRKGIRDERVLAAMARVPRERFVAPSDVRRAYADSALPIGFEQTISQPYMVAATCELLGLSGDENLLEVGTGSGYAAAVLAELARSVTSIERVPELAARARENLAAAGYERVDVVVGDGSLGVAEKAPFHAIAVAAAAPRVPESLYEQLAQGGRLVVPIGSRADQRLVLVVRSPEGPAEARSLPCRYVPLLGAEGF
jgi:protein-L-isoaspartate(D-aspartate) O-methyltransferase